jgi:hypothetical protein
MPHRFEDFTFLGLLNNGTAIHPLHTLGYLVALVDSPENEIVRPHVAAKALRSSFLKERKLKSFPELLSQQKQCFPEGYCPQTPVMLTLDWSPISAVLQRNFEPVVLVREAKRFRACASGIWDLRKINEVMSYEKCETSEELFWYVMKKVAEKAKQRNLLVSIVAKPG